MQFERQGFTNRNRVKLFDGRIAWLTVPIEHVGKDQLINEVKIANGFEPKWAERHWMTLKHNYRKARFWADYKGFFEEAYAKHWDMLIDLNVHLIEGIMGFLGIEKQLVMSSSLGAGGKRSGLVLAQCKKLGANVLYAGTGARGYLDVESFEESGVRVVFQEFKHPVYQQVHGAFTPNLSVADYLFCAGGKPWRATDLRLRSQGS